MIDKDGDRGMHTINMRNRNYKDITFLTKLMSNEDFASISVLDMSGNNLDDSGA